MKFDSQFMQKKMNSIQMIKNVLPQETKNSL